jgi:pyrimidine-nucleoside phosphorylase
MRPVDIIIKKRNGEELSASEISSFIQGFTNGDIPDYQVSAWAMAVLLKGMSARETADLTIALAESGDQLDLSSVVPFAVDKHSTGGVGDKTTLVVGPLVASCGVPVGKMSGRGLGFTGGTLDKMESIPGFNVSLSTEHFMKQLSEVGFVLAGQSADLAPADGKLYALRDVTGTVPSIPLIASSVMSKKIAGGAQAVVLDVKVGLGAFMATLEDARALAKRMVEIGDHADRQVIALISDMNQPLGCTVGNAIEVIEALDTLKGNGPDDFKEHCLEVAGHMLHLAGKAGSYDTCRDSAAENLENGLALDKFRQMVAAQGGDVSFIEDPSLLPKASIQRAVNAPASGFVQELHAGKIGLAAMALGAGRAKKGDPVDHSVGIVLERKVGDRVESGECLFTVYAKSETDAAEVSERLLASTRVSPNPVEPLPLFYETIMSS